MAKTDSGRVITANTIQGLAKFRKELKALGGDYVKALTREMQDIARPIEADSRRRYRSLHPVSRKNRRSERGIVATKRASGSAIRLGGKKYQYLQGQEWGTHGRFPQFPKPWGRTGRFFWPAIVEGAGNAAEKVFDEIDRLSRRVFPRR